MNSWQVVPSIPLKLMSDSGFEMWFTPGALDNRNGRYDGVLSVIISKVIYTSNEIRLCKEGKGLVRIGSMCGGPASTPCGILIVFTDLRFGGLLRGLRKRACEIRRGLTIRHTRGQLCLSAKSFILTSAKLHFRVSARPPRLPDAIGRTQRALPPRRHDQWQGLPSSSQ